MLKTDFCDPVELWITEYSAKHQILPVLGEIARLHPHIEQSLFHRLSQIRIGLSALTGLSLSSNLKNVKEALKFVICLYKTWPDAVAVRHRTKMMVGLRIRILMLAIENDLPVNDVFSLLNEYFDADDSQAENMHSSVAEISREGISAFVSEISKYLNNPSARMRRRLLETYNVVSPKNDSFRKIVESFVHKFTERFEYEVKLTNSGNIPKTCDLETAQRVAEIIAPTKMVLNQNTLTKLLKTCHENGHSSSTDNAESLFHFFCTAPEY